MRQRAAIVETPEQSPPGESPGLTLALEAASGIDRARLLHTELLEHLDSANEVIVGAAKVEQVHGAVLQLLCLFARERKERGASLRIAAPSPAFFEAASAIGAVDMLSLTRVNS